MKNEQWIKMREHLCTSGTGVAQCAWQHVGRTKHDQTIECWLINGMPAIFVIYPTGGFDVYTAHQAPREIDKVMPWLEAEAANR